MQKLSSVILKKFILMLSVFWASTTLRKKALLSFNIYLFINIFLQRYTQPLECQGQENYSFQLIKY